MSTTEAALREALKKLADAVGDDFSFPDEADTRGEWQHGTRIRGAVLEARKVIATPPQPVSVPGMATWTKGLSSAPNGSQPFLAVNIDGKKNKMAVCTKDVRRTVYGSCGNCVIKHTGKGFYATHWMPLPSPPAAIEQANDNRKEAIAA